MNRGIIILTSTRSLIKPTPPRTILNHQFTCAGLLAHLLPLPTFISSAHVSPARSFPLWQSHSFAMDWCAIIENKNTLINWKSRYVITLQTGDQRNGEASTGGRWNERCGREDGVWRMSSCKQTPATTKTADSWTIRWLWSLLCSRPKAGDRSNLSGVDHRRNQIKGQARQVELNQDSSDLATNKLAEATRGGVWRFRDDDNDNHLSWDLTIIDNNNNKLIRNSIEYLIVLGK